jgi:hypothetical protein
MAEGDEPDHVIVALSPRQVLDRPEQIVGGADQ